MPHIFFEPEYDRDMNDIEKHCYYEYMKIVKCGEEVLSNMGKYPVIRRSLKGAKQFSSSKPSWLFEGKLSMNYLGIIIWQIL